MIWGQSDTPAEDKPRVDTILAVDDEVLVRMVVADHLRDCGFRVVEAGNGREAIAILESDRAIDLVFSDIQMPEVSGFELAQWIRRERPEVRIILTSGGVKAAEAASELCENGPLMTKPYELDDVVRRVRALLARDKPANQA